jgi:hypothetical protein
MKTFSLGNGFDIALFATLSFIIMSGANLLKTMGHNYPLNCQSETVTAIP